MNVRDIIVVFIVTGVIVCGLMAMAGILLAGTVAVMGYDFRKYIDTISRLIISGFAFGLAFFLLVLVIPERWLE